MTERRRPEQRADLRPGPRRPDRCRGHGLVNLDAGATDLDGDALTYAASNLPPGLSIITSTGLITGTISSSRGPGPYAVSITVRDGATVDATDIFSWTVTEVPGRASPARGVQVGSNAQQAIATISLVGRAGDGRPGDVLLASIDTGGSSIVPAGRLDPRAQGHQRDQPAQVT